MAVTKEQADCYRKADPDYIAGRLGIEVHSEARNAVDVVMMAMKLPFTAALEALAAKVSPEDAAAHPAGQKPPKPKVARLKPHIYAITKEIKKQLDCIDAERYRITLFSTDEEKARSYSVGKRKGKDGSELFYTSGSVLAMIPRLYYENHARKMNVFVTPFPATGFLLLDDATDESLKAALSAGFRPNLIQHSSRKSIQAIFRIPADDRKRQTYNAVVRILNDEFGDKAISGIEHAWRLAGFANVKPKHLDPETGHYPFVRLDTLSPGIRCHEVERIIREVEAGRKPPPRPVKAKKTPDPSIEDLIEAPDDFWDEPPDIEGEEPEPVRVRQRPAKTSRSDEDFDALSKRIYAEAAPGADPSRVDWFLACEIARRGGGEDDIAAAIRDHRPDLSAKGSDAERYVRCTAAKAWRQESQPGRRP